MFYIDHYGTRHLLEASLTSYYNTKDFKNVKYTALRGLKAVLKAEDKVWQSIPRYRCWTSSGQETDIITGKFPWNVKNCTVILVSILFPNCWNGKLDSDDHISHLVYPNPKTKICPATHQTTIPQIQINARYKLPRPISWTQDNAPIMFSNGRSATDFHADILLAWDISRFQTIEKKCLKFHASKDCGSNDASLGFVPKTKTSACRSCVTFFPVNSAYKWNESITI